MGYSKLREIPWKNKEIYTKISLLMGGFHQLRIKQPLLYKCRFRKGYRERCVDAKTIAEGSIEVCKCIRSVLTCLFLFP